MGAFDLLLEHIHSQLPGGAPLTVRGTSLSWKVYTRTDAVAALRLMVRRCGREPMHLALHTEWVRGGALG